VVEAAAKTTELTGIAHKPMQVREFLKVLGMKPRKVGMFLAKAVDLSLSNIPRRPHHRRGANGFYRVEAKSLIKVRAEYLDPDHIEH
jgi:hypothetical protein